MSEPKYEKLYREQAEVCGDPFPEFVEFATGVEFAEARVLDLGCGQGRDALLFARHGMSVLGIDIAPTGVRQMLAAAETEGLRVEGQVSDVRDYQIDETFELVILDRTLHMIRDAGDRLQVLQKCAGWVIDGGYILIADERSNIPAFKDWFERDQADWQILPGMKPGFCFARRVCR